MELFLMMCCFFGVITFAYNLGRSDGRYEANLDAWEENHDIR